MQHLRRCVPRHTDDGLAFGHRSMRGAHHRASQVCLGGHLPLTRGCFPSGGGRLCSGGFGDSTLGGHAQAFHFRTRAVQLRTQTLTLTLTVDERRDGSIASLAHIMKLLLRALTARSTASELR